MNTFLVMHLNNFFINYYTSFMSFFGNYNIYILVFWVLLMISCLSISVYNYYYTNFFGLGNKMLDFLALFIPILIMIFQSLPSLGSFYLNSVATYESSMTVEVVGGINGWKFTILDFVLLDKTSSGIWAKYQELLGVIMVKKSSDVSDLIFCSDLKGQSQELFSPSESLMNSLILPVNTNIKFLVSSNIFSNFTASELGINLDLTPNTISEFSHSFNSIGEIIICNDTNFPILFDVVSKEDFFFFNFFMKDIQPRLDYLKNFFLWMFNGCFNYFINFVSDPWENLNPINYFKSPVSFVKYIASYFIYTFIMTSLPLWNPVMHFFYAPAYICMAIYYNIFGGGLGVYGFMITAVDFFCLLNPISSCYWVMFPFSLNHWANPFIYVPQLDAQNPFFLIWPNQTFWDYWPFIEVYLVDNYLLVFYDLVISVPNLILRSPQIIYFGITGSFKLTSSLLNNIYKLHMDFYSEKPWDRVFSFSSPYGTSYEVDLISVEKLLKFMKK